MRRRITQGIWPFFRSNDSLPTNPYFSFYELGSNYRCSANKRTCREQRMIRELEENLPYLENLPNGDHVGRFIGIYGRIVDYYPIRRGRKCLQYLYIWDGQLLKPHPMDYAPVCIYFDRYRSDKMVYWDSWHYNQGREVIPTDEPLVFHVNGQWHSFDLKRDIGIEGLRREEDEIEYCTDDHLWHWWDFDRDDAKLKLEDEFRDPEILRGMRGFVEREPIARSVVNRVKRPFISVISRASTLIDGMREFLTSVSLPFMKHREFDFAADFTLGTMMLLDSFQENELLYVPQNGGMSNYRKMMLKFQPEKESIQEINNIRSAIRRMEIDYESLSYGLNSMENSMNYFSDLKKSIRLDLEGREQADIELSKIKNRIEYNQYM